MIFFYSTGVWGGKPLYECNLCMRDYLSEEVMIQHIHTVHSDIHGMALQYEQQAEDRFQGLGGKVMLSVVCWQNDSTVRSSLYALLEECRRLKFHGITPVLGLAAGEPSEMIGGLVSEMEMVCLNNDIEFRYFTAETNVGASVLRNSLINLSADCDYILFTDGDIEIISYSSLALMALMEDSKSKGAKLACIGAYCNSYSTDRDKCTVDARYISSMLVRFEPVIAWTQYGLFDRRLLDVCSFDERFGAGWGFEDDDLAMQFQQIGYKVANVRGLCYLHRNIHSSLGELVKSGVDPNILFNQRKQYFLDKWRGVSHNVDGIQFPKEYV